jgi:hypothetical protein
MAAWQSHGDVRTGAVFVCASVAAMRRSTAHPALAAALPTQPESA